MSEISEATQILDVSVKVGEDIVKIGYKVGDISVKLIKLFFLFMKKVIMQEYRTKGRVWTRTLNRLNEEMCFARFPEERLEEVFQQLKARGVMYHILPDLNLSDGKKEIMFPVSAITRVNAVMETLGIGKIISLDEYEQNAEPGAIESETEKLKDELGVLDSEYSSKKKVNDNMKEFERNVNFQNQVRHHKKEEITINEGLVIRTTDTHYITRVPYRRERILIAKKDARWIDNGKTLLTYLDMEKKYPMCSQNGEQIPSKTGKELYKHYDPVNRIKQHKQKESTSKKKQPKKVSR